MATQDEVNYQNQLAAQRRWRAENKIKLSEDNHACKTKHKERLKEARRVKDAAKKAGTWVSNRKGANHPRRRLHVYKQNARRDGREWTLTDEEALGLITGQCHYCGSAAAPTNGIDREKNEEGYRSDNVKSACWTCNRMKWTMKYDDFIAHVKKICVMH